MKKKICTKCKLKKSLVCFEKANRGKFNVRADCKDCRSAYKKEYQKITNYSKIWYQNNKKQHRQACINWRLNNIDRARELDRNFCSNPKNRIKINATKRAYYHKRKQEPLYKLIYRVRNRTKQFFRDIQFMKKVDFPDYIGCSPNELFQYIESKFQKGMNWERFDKAEIHIDHIIPISKAKTKKAVYKLSHYTNLQPLWAKDNLKKSDKVYAEYR